MRFLLVFVLLFSLSGCQTFNPMNWFKSSKSQVDIPSEPRRNFDDIEDIKKNIGIITDISQLVHTTGVNVQSYESETLLKSAKVLQTISGLPTDIIDWRIKKDVSELHRTLLEREGDFRRERSDWIQDINSLRDEKMNLVKENSRLSSALDYWKWWLWATCIALGSFIFFCPTLGIPLVKFLLGRVKKAGEVAIVETASALKTQMGQVVKAIEDYKRDDPENAKKLLDKLEKKTDSHTRHLINELKR